MADTNRVTVGDREGVVVRSVKIAGGTEYTVQVPDDQDSLEEFTPNLDPHALVLDGHGNTSATPGQYADLSVADALADQEERDERIRKTNERETERRLAAADDGDAPASQKPTGDDKPLTTDKAVADRKVAADRKAADRKAGDTK